MPSGAYSVEINAKGNSAKRRREKYASLVIDYGSGGKVEYRQAPDGRLYNADTMEFVGTKMSLKDVAERAQKAGYAANPYTAKQTAERDEARRKERENRPDYEVGYGTPWGNREYRRTARMNKINTRAQKRK